MNVFKFARDYDYQTDFDLWLNRVSIPGVKCDVCGVWMIPTTHPDLSVSDEIKDTIKKLKAPITPENFARIRRLFPDIDDNLFPGAEVGNANIRKVRGLLKREFAWFEGAVILNENDFQQLREATQGELKGVPVIAKENQQSLIELVPVPLNLRRVYPKERCSVCGRRVSEIARKELESIYELVKRSGTIYAIPGGLVCGDRFRKAVEALGLRNCTFTDWTA